jgi:hypothetical protein
MMENQGSDLSIVGKSSIVLSFKNDIYISLLELQ